MAVMNLVQAVNSAIDEKLADDENVLVFGQDVGRNGGVFRATDGLQDKYGEKRVFDTPLAESSIVGAGVGMAMEGLRPICEIQFSGFIYPAFNQIISNVSRMWYRSRGTRTAPMVIRAPYGGGIRALESHSESAEAIYGHIPGLKVVIPSTPYDAKGLLISSIEDDDPVLFLEPKKIYRAIKQDVPEKLYRIKIGKASVLQKGEQLTLIAYGAMIKPCQQAIQMAKKEGYSIELIDLRTIFPLDKETVIASVKKTGRMVTVHEAPRSFGVGAELMALANEDAFLYLEAPPARVTGADTIVPLPKGEDLYLPDAERIFDTIKKTIKF